MSTVNHKLSITEKVGYALGDLAANLVFQTLVTFIAFFYTDVYGIEAGWAAFIIFWAGIIGGAVFTPVMGAIADRTRDGDSLRSDCNGHLRNAGLRYFGETVVRRRYLFAAGDDLLG